jgi:tetratricopeptide (TPR) repeat protein
MTAARFKFRPSTKDGQPFQMYGVQYVVPCNLNHDQGVSPMHSSSAFPNKYFSLNKLAASLVLFCSSVMAVYLSPAVAILINENSILANAAYAADQERRAPPTARTSEPLSTRVAARIEQIIELEGNEQYAEARAILDELRGMHDNGRLNNRETSMMWLFYARMDQAEENFGGAIENYRRMLAVPNLDQERLEQTWLLLGSLHLAIEEFQQAIDAFNTYNALALEPNPDAYFRLATAYYQLEQYEAAIEPLLKNMELVRARGETVPENVYGLLRALYLIQEDYANARQVLREMIVLYNKPDDWDYLAQIEGQLENFTAQAHTYYVANAADMLDTESQLINFASHLFNNDNPYGCATVIETGMEEGIIEQDEDNLALIAQCYQQAREDARAAPLLEQAAMLSDDGELYNWLGRVYMTIGEFDKAVDAFDMALEKGGIARPDQLYLAQASAYRELNRFDEGLAAVRNAARDERSSATARAWITVLTNEKERYELFQQQRRDLAQYFR